MVAFIFIKRQSGQSREPADSLPSFKASSSVNLLPYLKCFLGSDRPIIERQRSKRIMAFHRKLNPIMFWCNQFELIALPFHLQLAALIMSKTHNSLISRAQFAHRIKPCFIFIHCRVIIRIIHGLKAFCFH